MAKPKTRTMYMHTLDGYPAVFQTNGTGGAAWLAYVGGRNKVRLTTSLSQIRKEWNRAAESCAEEEPGTRDAGVAYIRRCGYVLVEVPSSAR